MKLTWLDANSWLVEAAGKRILVDPWLVGDLVFGNAPWLVRGYRSEPIAIPKDIDLILLSQGLADHAHPETLEQLDKSIPVMASPDGAKVAESFGYQSVTGLTHGETALLGSEADGVRVQTFVGAPVGVTKKENAYVLTFLAEDTRLYYEPHGYPDAEHLNQVGAVDVVITPMADITLFGLAPVVTGKAAAPQLANLLKPQVMLPTAEAGRVEYSGLIAGALRTSGGADELRSQFAEQGLKTEVIRPMSGELLTLSLRSAAAV